jgi:hypothetical protein
MALVISLGKKRLFKSLTITIEGSLVKIRLVRKRESCVETSPEVCNKEIYPIILGNTH